MRTNKKVGIALCTVGMTVLPFVFGFVVEFADSYQDADGIVLWLVAGWIVCVLGLVTILGSTDSNGRG